MLQVENLTMSYGNKKIFDNFSISGFDKYDKIGIIGDNGRGKSTFLKLVGGIIKADSGKIKFDIKNPLIGYMNQEFDYKELDSGKSIIEYLKESSGCQKLEQEINEIYEELSLNSDSNSEGHFKMEKLGEIQEQYEKLGGYNFEYIVDYMIMGLIGEKLDKNTKISELSGGQKSKILLIEALLKGGDILLLDEPTNNLDIKSVNWLIEYINDLNSIVFIVSHDKFFLNEITNKILELGKSEINLYSGNYDFYEMQKELAQNSQNKAYSQYAEKFKELNEKLNLIKSKKSGTEKAKAGPDTDPRRKFQQNYAQNSSGKNIKRLKNELEILAKNKPKIEKTRPLSFELNLDEKVYGGIYVNNLDFVYSDSGNGIFVENFIVENGEKVLIFGDNGSGKTTFLKLLNGELKFQKKSLNSPLNRGDDATIKISPSIKIGNYAQEKQILNKCDDTLLKFLEKNIGTNVGTKDFLSLYNNILVKFNFTEEEKSKKVSLLSPGQKNRLLLALFSLAKYNTLILDEPTNHLDLEAVNELERALKIFNGNLIVVSHDRGFIKNISFDKYYKMSNGKMREEKYV